MSTAPDLFFDALGRGIAPDNRDQLELFEQAATQWRTAGQHFNAGYAMSRALVAVSWKDGPRVAACINAQLADYRICVSSQPSNSHESLAALWKWSTVLQADSFLFSDKTGARRTGKSLQEELAQCLVRLFGDSPNADSYLVTGFVLTSDMEGAWQPSFPEYEVPLGEEGSSGREVRINLPSAFHLFVSLGDYHGAQQVITQHPDAFSTPSLRGWRSAVAGFLRSDDAAELFAEAANAFAEDTEPSDEELLARGGSWSSINRDFWAKYFRARAALARAPRERDRAQEFVREASAELEGTESGWVNPQVTRFRLLVRALANLVGEEPAVSPDQARAELLRELELFGEDDDDPLILQFLTAATQAFDDFRGDPALAVTTGHLPVALDTLGRISLVGAGVAEAVRPAVGAGAVAEMQGPVRTWIHRTLESISDEAQLRRIILRLAQSSLPRYAQIRHGPLEYGKDIVVVLNHNGRRILRMYQAKVGNITTPKWRNARDELEEMFLVPLSDLQIASVDDREGVLVCNGHTLPHVEPTMQGWFEAQKRDHNRDFEFMHLDSLVNWIINDRLVNELRAALEELQVEIVVG